jgi:predicted ABC-type ATPase
MWLEADRFVTGRTEVPGACAPSLGLVVRRRFDRSARNFFRDYQPLVDSWYLFDNTDTKPVAIAFKKGTKLRIMKHEMYKSLVVRYGEK